MHNRKRPERPPSDEERSKERAKADQVEIHIATTTHMTDFTLIVLYARTPIAFSQAQWRSLSPDS